MNYCMVQMGGGDFACQFSHEFMFWRASFLAHDTYDFIQMLSDCVLDEKTVIDEECAMWRVDEYWKLRELNLTHDQRLKDLWLTLAYGQKGLGMPLNGYQSHF